MITKYIFVQSKQIMNFLFDTFLVTISGLPFLFPKVRILLSVYKLNRSTML